MARADAIWVVETLEYSASFRCEWELAAAFTVKHELVSWLQKRRERQAVRRPLRITRMRDGATDSFMKTFTEKELLDT